MIDPQSILFFLLSSVSGFLGSLGSQYLPAQDLVNRSFLNCCGITVKASHLDMDWPLGLNAHNLEMRDKKGKLVLKAKKFHLDAHPADLIRAPRFIREARLEGVTVFLDRNQKGEWNLGRLLQNKSDGPPVVGLKKLVIKDLQLVVNDHRQHPVLKVQDRVQSLVLDLSKSPRSMGLLLQKNWVNLNATLQTQGWENSKLVMTIKRMPIEMALQYAKLGWIEPLPKWAWPKNGLVSGTLHSRGGKLHGKFDLLALKRGNSLPLNLSTVFHLGKEGIEITKLKATSGKGTANLSLKCWRGEGKAMDKSSPCLRGNMSMFLQNFPVESLTAYSPFSFSRDLRGAISGQLVTTGQAGSPQSYQGWGDLSLKNGRMMALLPGEETMQVNLLKTNFKLSGGFANFSNLYLDADSLGLDMTGKFGFGGSLDFKGKVRLSEDQVTRLGLARLRPLLKDKDEKREFLVKLKGTTQQPQIDPAAMQTLKAGLSDQVKDAGNSAERATRKLGNKVESVFRKIF